MSDVEIPLISRRAWLVWYRERLGGSPEGPAEAYLLDPLAPPHFAAGLLLVAPRGLDSFLDLLRDGSPRSEDWLRFLSQCRLVEGEITGQGRRLEVWRERDALSALREAAQEEEAEEIRPGTGPALLPVPGGRVPLNEPFLEAIRDHREFLGLAGEGVGRGAIWVWAVPKADHLNVVLLLHDAGARWSILLNPFRIPSRNAPGAAPTR